MVCLIADKLGLLDKVTENKTVDEWIRFGFDNSGVSPFITYADLEEKKYFVVPVKPDWEPSKPNSLAFYNDPE